MLMMAANGQSSMFDRLVQQFQQLPGIGKRSAERLAFHLLKRPTQEATALADAIRDMKENVRHCSMCYNLSESDPCPICDDPQRDSSTILVVEQPSDVLTIETTGMYRGRYHVLMGKLAPLDGVGPGELNINGLLNRVRDEQVKEVIVATNPTIEGDGTALYLAEQLSKDSIKVSRLARGLATGSHLETAPKAVLADAIQGRHQMQ